MELMKQSEKIGKFWSKRTNSSTSPGSALRVRWWQDARIIAHINKRVCGENVAGFSQGLIQKIKADHALELPFHQGISVGCGTALKEIHLVKENIVAHFHLYELSDERIEIGKKNIERAGLSSRLQYIKGNAFDLVKEAGCYDLVHWNNSLHHMFDVLQAVQWSKKILRSGGLFYMDDFIGPTGFQWTDRQLELASRVREIFRGSTYISDPRGKGDLPTEMTRPNAARLWQDDPSEAADSSNILDAIKATFTKPFIQTTGGVIYHLALKDMLANFDHEETDSILLDLLLLIDELVADLGENHYAVALAIKE